MKQQHHAPRSMRTGTSRHAEQHEQHWAQHPSNRKLVELKAVATETYDLSKLSFSINE